MADLQFTAQLDSKGFLTELNTMEKATRERAGRTRDYLRQLERREDKAAGGGAGGAASAMVGAALKTMASVKLLRAAWNYASGAVEDYAKKNEVVGNSMAATTNAAQTLSQTIGSVLGRHMENIADVSTYLVRGLDSAIKATKAWTDQQVLGAEAAGLLNQAVEQQESAMLRYAEAAKKVEATNRGLVALDELKDMAGSSAIARMSGLDPAEGDRMQLRADRDKSLAEAQGKYARLTAEQQKSFDLASLTYDINSRYNQSLSEITYKLQQIGDENAKNKAKFEDEVAAAQEAIEMRKDEIDRGHASREIDILRLNGKDDLADKAALELDAGRELQLILSDVNIEEQDRLRFAEQTLELYQQQGTALDKQVAKRATPESTRARTLASGLGGGLTSQVLGVGSGVVSEGKSISTLTLISNQRLAELVALTKQLRDKNSTGTFGP